MNRKEAMREGIRVLTSAAGYLASTYGAENDLRPWATNDHPISVAHWVLCQFAFRLRWSLRSTRGGPKAQPAMQRATDRAGIASKRASTEGV